ncbi:hypothetical protein AB0M25_07110 [Streptomyces griseomycini]|uniref:hypothetical protein n=1 Tax=Streptomyces griseomycini TaxID=66895 RepID=UPI0034363760
MMAIFGLLGWPAIWFGMLYVLIGFLPRASVFLFALPLCYTFYRAAVQMRHVTLAFRVRSVIREYPWQVFIDVPRGIDEHPDAEGRGIWIEFPDPSGCSRKGVPLVFVKHYRAFWWLRRIGGPRTKPRLKAQLGTLWFAGDPRFLGVVAVPSCDGITPKRMHFLYQPSAFEEQAERRGWDGVEPSDLERARRAGACFALAAASTGAGANNQEGTGA